MARARNAGQVALGWGFPSSGASRPWNVRLCMSWGVDVLLHAHPPFLPHPRGPGGCQLSSSTLTTAATPPTAARLHCNLQVFIFTRASSTDPWNWQATLQAPVLTWWALFGWCVAVSADGSTVAVVMHERRL